MLLESGQASFTRFYLLVHCACRSQSEDYTELVTTDNVEDAAKLAESSLPDLHDGELVSLCNTIELETNSLELLH